MNEKNDWTQVGIVLLSIGVLCMALDSWMDGKKIKGLESRVETLEKEKK